MTSYGPEREADRIRVILETLAYAQPELLLKDAVPMVFEIERRTAELESPVVDDFSTATGVARWIDKPANKDIQDLLSGSSPVSISSPKIHAIKEVRARTAIGLKEAKQGVEAWCDGKHLPF